MSSHNDSPEASGAPAEGELRADVQQAGDALLKLATTADPQLARTLARLVETTATEAARTPRFAKALEKALAGSPSPPERTAQQRSRGSHRRAPGVLDPFAVFTETGEEGLRTQLGELDLEQLRDIVAEHGMDYDRLAMKWKTPGRVVDRIVERVQARTAKGSAFRQH